MPSSLVSIILPIHNRFPLVDKCIFSVITQTYRPLELIIIDDKSDIPYIPKYSSENGFSIKTIYNPTNIGPGGSRETGRLLASGEFILYLDSDDLLLPEMLEKLEQSLMLDPEAGMTYCKTLEFTELPITGSENLRRRNDKSFDTFLPTIFEGRPWSTSSCLWTRKATDLIGPWFSGWTWEDYEYDVRAGCAGLKIIHCPDILCYKRNHFEDQLSNITGQKAIEQKSLSIFEISKNLLNSNYFNNRDVSKIFVEKILKPNFIKLISIQNYRLAKENFNYLFLFNDSKNDKVLQNSLIEFLLLFIRNRMFLRVVKRTIYELIKSY